MKEENAEVYEYVLVQLAALVAEGRRLNARRNRTDPEWVLAEAVHHAKTIAYDTCLWVLRRDNGRTVIKMLAAREQLVRTYSPRPDGFPEWFEREQAAADAAAAAIDDVLERMREHAQGIAA